MKQRSLLTAVLSAPALFGCQGEPAGPRVLEPIRGLTAQETQVAVRSNSFGLHLMREVAGAESKPNLMISPLSASVALGMALNGARGGTYDAMRNVLGYSGMSNDEINEAYRGLIAQLRARDPKVEFELANSVWHERTFSVEAAFLDATRRSFDAHVAGIDFRSPSAITTMNDWVARATGNRIRDLISQISNDDVMFIINAVYFKAPWTQAFEPAATTARPFRLANGTSVNVPTMSMDAGLRHFVGDGIKAVELLYADSAYSMVVMAPASDDAPLSSIVAHLTPERWAAWLDRFQPGRLMLSMPKFRFEYAVQLKAPLTNMGMGVAFVPRQADFSGINPSRDDLHISSVLQKSFIDVHELGTEAAAATAITISITSMPPEIRFDRPFLFAIRERSTGTLLFVGRIGDPR